MVPDNSVVNLMQVAPSQQVLLKVRFIEANRDTGRDLGVNWFVSNKNGTQGFNTGHGGENATAGQSAASGLPLFQALGTFAGSASAPPFGSRSPISPMAARMSTCSSARWKPRVLRAAWRSPISSRCPAIPQASWRVGRSRAPVVQPSSGGATTITVDYKPFGVQLTFVPTVLANGVINLRLTPSVSQLDYTNAIRNQGFLIPALTKREARTTIELRDGQSFSIAGLLQTTGLRDIRKSRGSDRCRSSARCFAARPISSMRRIWW